MQQQDADVDVSPRPPERLTGTPIVSRKAGDQVFALYVTPVADCAAHQHTACKVAVPTESECCVACIHDACCGCT